MRYECDFCLCPIDAEPCICSIRIFNEKYFLNFPLVSVNFWKLVNDILFLNYSDLRFGLIFHYKLKMTKVRNSVCYRFSFMLLFNNSTFKKIRIN